MDISVVVPVHNEAENIAPLVTEIVAALEGRWSYEIIYVDDGSTDGTAEALLAARRKLLFDLRIIRHSTACGQSTAIHTGVHAARGRLIATLDGDGQNNPADIPNLIEAFTAHRGADNLQLVIGHRTRRHDNLVRRLSSRIANAVRSALLKDHTPDTGCGLKVFARSAFLSLPYFDHMHRFLPALIQRQGGTVRSVPVDHRARERGRSKYGIHNRLWVGIVDLFGVAWLRRRERRPAHIEEVGAENVADRESYG